MDSGPAATRKRRREIAWQVFFALALLGGLAAVNRPGFLLFHSLAEIFTIVAAISTALVAWNAREYLENDYLLFLGIGQFFVAIIDTLHMLGYQGMSIFAASGPNLSTSLWIAGRYLGSASLVVAVLFLRRRVPLAIVLTAYTVLTTAAFALIFTGHFPRTFTTSLTPFKVGSEYVVAALYATAAWLLFRNRQLLDRIVFNMIFASIVLRVVAELMFAAYSNVYDALAFTGHYIRIIAFYLIYKAIFEAGIVRPYATVVADLRKREADLRQSMQELEAFSYSVSHDLRSPVAVISGFAQLLQLDHAATMTQESRTYVAQIRASVDRMAELIEDLLSFSRASRLDIKLETVDVTSLARDIGEHLRASATDRDVDLDIAEGMVGKADARLLRVVLENLLGNAWKFTSKHPRARIEIRRKNEDGQQVFMVRDDGAGFDMQEAQGRLFRPFQRLHTSSQFDGNGVGLATVSRIVERHGGRVWAESEVEKGTTVYFALPE